MPRAKQPPAVKKLTHIFESHTIGQALPYDVIRNLVAKLPPGFIVLRVPGAAVAVSTSTLVNVCTPHPGTVNHSVRVARSVYHDCAYVLCADWLAEHCGVPSGLRVNLPDYPRDNVVLDVTIGVAPNGTPAT